MEQLLQTLPSEIKVRVTERKPKTSTEAAEMADNYLRARKQQKDGHRQQEGQQWAIAKVHGKVAKEWTRLQNQR